jgi:hypothetical protein
MELEWDGVLADRLDRFGQDQLAAIDLEALPLEEVGDVGRRHRAVQLVGVTDAPDDHDVDGVQARGDSLGLALLFRLALLDDLALALDVLLVAVGGRQRQLPGQEVVAGIAVGDLDDLAALAQFLDMFSQNNFIDLNLLRS